MFAKFLLLKHPNRKDFSKILCITPSSKISSFLHEEIFLHKVIPPKIVNLYIDITVEFLFINSKGKLNDFTINTEIGEIKRRLALKSIISDILAKDTSQENPHQESPCLNVSSFVGDFIKIENLMLSNLKSKSDLISVIEEMQPNLAEQWLNNIDLFLLVYEAWQEYKLKHNCETRIEKRNRNINHLCKCLEDFGYEEIYFISPIGTNIEQIKVLKTVLSIPKGNIILQGLELKTLAIKNIISELGIPENEIQNISQAEKAEETSTNPKENKGNGSRKKLIHIIKNYNFLTQVRCIVQIILNISTGSQKNIGIVTKNPLSAQLITTSLLKSSTDKYIICNSFGYSMKNNLYWRLFWSYMRVNLKVESLHNTLFLLKAKYKEGISDTESILSDSENLKNLYSAEFSLKSSQNIVDFSYEDQKYIQRTSSLKKHFNCFYEKEINENNIAGTDIAQFLDILFKSYLSWFDFSVQDLEAKSVDSIEFVKFIKELQTEVKGFTYKDNEDFLTTIEEISNNRHYRPHNNHPTRFKEKSCIHILTPEEGRLIPFDYLFFADLTSDIIPAKFSENSIMNSSLQEVLNIKRNNASIEWHDFLTLERASRNVIFLHYITNISKKLNRTSQSLFLTRFFARSTKEGAKDDAKDGDTNQITFKFLDSAIEFLKLLPAEEKNLTPEVQVSSNMMPERFYPTHIMTLLKNPYDFYVQYILRLKKLFPIISISGNAQYGTLVHDSLQQCVIKKDERFSVFDFIMDALNNIDLKSSLYAFLYKDNLRKIALELEGELKKNIFNDQVNTRAERKEAIKISDLATVTAKIDRFDINESKKIITIIDYKLKKSFDSKSIFKNIPYIKYNIGESCIELDQVTIEAFILANLEEYKGFAFNRLYYFLNVSQGKVVKGFEKEEYQTEDSTTEFKNLNQDKLNATCNNFLKDLLKIEGVRSFNYEVSKGSKNAYYNPFSHFARFFS